MNRSVKTYRMEASLYPGQYSLWKKYPQSKLADCSRTSVSKTGMCKSLYKAYGRCDGTESSGSPENTKNSLQHKSWRLFFIIYSRNKVTSSPKNCSFSYAPMIEYVASSILFFFKEPIKLKI